MAEHILEAGEHSLYGAFSPNRAPLIRIQSGDTVISNTPDAGWGLLPPDPDGTPRTRYKRPEEAKDGHAMIGPLYIEGAHPGKTLLIHIEELIPDSFGYTFSGGFPHRINEGLGLIEGGHEMLVWTLDPQTMVGTTQHGHQVRLKPFLGVMGMPPPEAGSHPTAPPRKWGGNIDCKDLVVGTRLYLPISVEGALFSFGDGHAAQGHGEVSVTAIECGFERVRLRFEVLDLTIDTPHVWTPDGWLTLAFDANLEQAALMATGAMVDLMMALYPDTIKTRRQALGLATAVVDLHVTQIANPTMGVHAFLPHDAFIGVHEANI